MWAVSRYPMYIESDAWVTNLKQKLACGSIIISNKMEYYEFFTRALQPGLHYVQVDPGDLCNDTAFKVWPASRSIMPCSCCQLCRSSTALSTHLLWPVCPALRSLAWLSAQQCCLHTLSQVELCPHHLQPLKIHAAQGPAPGCEHVVHHACWLQHEIRPRCTADRCCMNAMQVNQMNRVFKLATQDGAKVGLGRKVAANRASQGLQRTAELAQSRLTGSGGDPAAASQGQGSVADAMSAPWAIGTAGQQVMLDASLPGRCLCRSGPWPKHGALHLPQLVFMLAWQRACSADAFIVMLPTISLQPPRLLLMSQLLIVGVPSACLACLIKMPCLH